MHRTLVAIALLAGGTAACGGGGPDTALTGVYQIDAWTENTAGCDSEGPSVLVDMTDTALYIKIADIFGFEFISAATCADVPTCASEGADDTINLSGYAFEEGSDDAGWTGNGHFISGSDSCSGEVFEWTLTSPAPDTVVITTRAKMVSDIPLDSDGFCDGDAAEAAAANQPCDALEVITASLAQPL